MHRSRQRRSRGSQGEGPGCCMGLGHPVVSGRPRAVDAGRSHLPMSLPLPLPLPSPLPLVPLVLYFGAGFCFGWRPGARELIHIVWRHVCLVMVTRARGIEQACQGARQGRQLVTTVASPDREKMGHKQNHWLQGSKGGRVAPGARRPVIWWPVH